MTNDDDLFARAGARLGAPTPAEAARAREHTRVVRGMIAVERRRIALSAHRRRFAARGAGGVVIAAIAVYLAGKTTLHASSGDAPGPEPVTFRITAKEARRVALVGEFNGWNAHATPMTRAGGNRWEVTLAVAPGRHTYAFVVNDSTWVADPSAPSAPERWFGDPRSVLVVASAR